MSVLIRKYKLVSGMHQEERIDDEDRIERYMKLFDREDVKKIQSGQKVKIEKDDWQLLEDQLKNIGANLHQ